MSRKEKHDGELSEQQLDKVAGGQAESIFQPEWSPDGRLHFVSDRTGWWNLYRLQDGTGEPLCPMAAEFGRPQWVFGMGTYAIAPDGRAAIPRRCLCAGSRAGHGARLRCVRGKRLVA